MNHERRYRSEIAAVWITLCCACVFALSMGEALRVQSPGVATALCMAALVVVLVFICFAVPCRYVLMAEMLSVQSGLFILLIPYAEIRSVTIEQSWSWAPALSPKRIVLHCARGNVRISPVRPHDFLAELGRRLPQPP